MTTVPPQLLGLTVSGDMGGNTYFTNKNHKVVVFPVAPPKKPPSLNQLIQRYRFRMTVASWTMRPPYIQNQYTLASERMSLCMTGLNLYLHLAFAQDWNTIHTIFNQTGITLGMPPDPRGLGW